MAEGTVTLDTSEVDTSPHGMPAVKVQTRMTTQNDDTILKGTAEIRLPL